MLAAKPFVLVTLGMLPLLAGIEGTTAQETNPPPRPASRIYDEGSLFEFGERSEIAAGIRARLDALQVDTGCDVLIATVTTATGSSPRLLADQFAATWLKSGGNGAVLVYERAGNRIGISATEPVRQTIADYAFASIEQSLSGNREDTPPAEAVSLATGDLVGLFRKNFGEDASREHPSIKADKFLFAAVAACIVALIAMVAFLHWRGERAQA